jgi:hypothetical protein
VFLSTERQLFTGAAGTGEEGEFADGEVPAFKAAQHFDADGTGSSNNGNVWLGHGKRTGKVGEACGLRAELAAKGAKYAWTGRIAAEELLKRRLGCRHGAGLGQLLNLRHKKALCSLDGKQRAERDGRGLDLLFEEGEASALIFDHRVTFRAQIGGTFGGTGEVEEAGYLAIRTGRFADVEVISLGGFFRDDAEGHKL